MGFFLGLVVGVVVTGVVFIVFGAKNKKKIAEARAQILETYGKVEGPAKDVLDGLLKKFQ